MRRVFLAALLAASIPVAQAVSITFNDLPAAVQQSCNPATCLVTLQSSADTQGMSAFRYMNYDIPSATLFDGWLIRYDLVAPSQHTAFYDPSYFGGSTGPTTTITPYGGHVWLQASNAYNLSSPSHSFTLFLDTVAPPSSNNYNGYGADPNVITLGLTTAALLGGGGFVQASGDPDYTITGSLQSSMWSCVECGWRTDFNLVFLNYSTGALNFDLSDQRALLFSQSDYWVNFLNCDQFYVQAVPLPAALPLLSTGLALLSASGLRRRKTN